MRLIRFFFTLLLPMSATGAAAVLALAATNGLLHRLGKTRWGLRAVMAALCLFIFPLTALRLPSLPQAASPEGPGTVYRAEPEQPAVSAAPVQAAPAKNVRVSEERGVSVFGGVLPRILPALWLAGAAAVIAGTGVSYGRFCLRLRQESRPADVPHLQSRFARAKQATGLKRFVHLYQTDALHSPMAVGLLAPGIYLPVRMGEGDMEALDCALYHECMHLRRGHIAYKLLAQAVCAVHWFNPAAWLLRRMVNEACEFDCDRAATRGMDGDSRLRYCTALLDAAEGGGALALASAFARPAKTLRKRMEAILMPKQNRAKQILSLTICAALLLGMVGLTACAAQDAAKDADTALANALPQSSSTSDPANELQTDDPASQPVSPAQPDGSTPDNAAGEPVQAAPDVQPEYVWPVKGYTILSRQFSTVSAAQDLSVHSGIDIPAPEGTDIVAVWDGVVEEVTYDFTLGNTVQVYHENGIYSRYAHCQDIVVQEGDSVKAGQVVAHVGNTGNSTGNHCHLEMEQDGYYVDPGLFLGMENPSSIKLSVLQMPTAQDETGYVWPVPVFKYITTRFTDGAHRGIDIAAQRGADIVAIRDGIVAESNMNPAYGNCVLLDHGDGFHSLYAHCEDLVVEAGDTVKAGQVIAHIGSTGVASGTHCHLEIQQNETPVDPASFFDIEQIMSTVTFLPGMGCSNPYCTDASHHHDCPADCTDYSHHHTCPLDCTDTSHHHAGVAAANFIAGMGCSDPYCTDASHHHDCPANCTDYSHHHTCPLNCTDASHHHGWTISTAGGGHHSESGHHGRGHH